MKIDLDVIKEVPYSVEEIFSLIKLEFTRVGQPIKFTSETEEIYIKLVDTSLLARKPEGLVLTRAGRTLLTKLLDVTYKKQEVIPPEAYNFKEYWEHFPPTDKHGMWLRTRGLRADKARTKVLYDKAILEGAKHDDIMKALKWEVTEKKKMSITNNKLSFMKASTTWLHQKEYEIILEELSADDSDDAFSDDGDWTTGIV